MAYLLADQAGKNLGSWEGAVLGTLTSKGHKDAEKGRDLSLAYHRGVSLPEVRQSAEGAALG
jgi:hypothetical protein